MRRTLLKETLAELFQWMLVGQIIATFGAWIIVDWVKSFLLSAVVIDKDDMGIVALWYRCWTVPSVRSGYLNRSPCICSQPDNWLCLERRKATGTFNRML